MKELSLQQIGIIHSTLKNLEDCPLQGDEGAPEAWVEIYPEYKAALEGIMPGEDFILLTWLHHADRSILKCYMRNYKDTPPVGVFITRSPDRPNPIGLHQVRVLEVDQLRIKVFPLEALDGTWIIDIKPVI